jgi:hypothetical protein
MKVNKYKQKLTLQISNILRSLGLNFSIKGTVLINEAIRIMLEEIEYENYLIVNDIYIRVAEYYNIDFLQVKTYIQYALDHRNIIKSKENFEKVFGFEYNTYYFTSKRFLEEIFNLLIVYNNKDSLLQNR